ncbi:hypothetical protein BVI1335_830058 [Burkholderia vietnamiensis]|nr:hypothetical protein BVI1335_830058 [Burkholderia vietnamiensis]
MHHHRLNNFLEIGSGTILIGKPRHTKYLSLQNLHLMRHFGNDLNSLGLSECLKKSPRL